MTNTETQKQYSQWFGNINLGTPTTHQGVAVYPIFSRIPSSIDYLGLTTAIERKIFEVTEVDEGGHVPELKVKNTSQRPVLLVDGEELEGAKQNRTLNSSILVPAESEILIPVSCTEQGRWHYSSGKEFKSSGHVLESKTRARKMRSVSKSLKKEMLFESNQSEVWEGIHQFECNMASHSPTSAHKDVYKQSNKSFEEGFEKFKKLEDGQRGILVVIGGQPVGLDFVSRPEVYADVHQKLIMSYVFEPLIREPKSEVREGRATRAAAAFIARAKAAKTEAFESVGHGVDLRAEARQLVGTILNHEGEALHVSFLSLPKEFDLQHEHPEAQGHTSPRSQTRQRPSRRDASGYLSQFPEFFGDSTPERDGPAGNQDDNNLDDTP